MNKSKEKRWCARSELEPVWCALVPGPRKPHAGRQEVTACGKNLTYHISITGMQVPTCPVCNALLEVKRLKKENSNLKHYLVALTESVRVFNTSLESIVTSPASHERGRLIATLQNGLDMVNDQARYFGLHIDCKKDLKKANK